MDIWRQRGLIQRELAPCGALTLERFGLLPFLPQDLRHLSDLTCICWSVEGLAVGMEDSLLKHTISSGLHDTLQCRKTLPVDSGT